MVTDNKRNVLYFEAESMRALFAQLDAWQEESRKRLHSINVQREGHGFACIALTNPTEVIIVDGYVESGGVTVSADGALKVYSLNHT